MRKKILAVIGITAFAAVVAFNISVGRTNSVSSELTLSNIEALGNGETSGEFAKICCEGSWYNLDTCTACNGNCYSAANWISGCSCN